LHDEEVWVIYVELDGLEEVMYGLLLCADTVDEVFACAPENNLYKYPLLAMYAGK